MTAGTTGGVVVAGVVGAAVVGVAPVVVGAVVGGVVAGSVVGSAVVAAGAGAAEVVDGALPLPAVLPCGPQPTRTAADSAAVTAATVTATGDLLRLPIMFIPLIVS